jgi:uncharacterized membrane protein
MRRILRARIIAGLVVVLPLWITFLLVKFIFEVMRDTSLWVVVYYLRNTESGGLLAARWGVEPGALREQGLGALPVVHQWVIGLGCVFLTMLFLYVVGLLTANFIGRRLVATVERIVGRVPFVKTVYSASKQVLEILTGKATQSFQRVAMIPFPTKETRSLGFITGIMRDEQTGEELCTAFIATTPNPTTGFVFILKRSDVIELDWTVEQAVSLIMSGGMVVPPTIPFARPPQRLLHPPDRPPGQS